MGLKFELFYKFQRWNERTQDGHRPEDSTQAVQFSHRAVLPEEYSGDAQQASAESRQWHRRVRNNLISNAWTCCWELLGAQNRSL